MKNISIGIKVLKNSVSVFYCGMDGKQLREAHQELLKKNKNGAKFYRIQNPLLVPLDSVVHSTEEHPEVVKANEARKKMSAQEAGEVQNEVVDQQGEENKNNENENQDN